MRPVAGLAVGLAVAVLPAAGAAASLQVDVEGAEPGGGTVRVALCQGGLAESACAAGDDAEARGRGIRILFRDVAPGTYAVAAFQDGNGNGRLDRTGLGLPLEPYGFSGESGRRARPDFADAAFVLREPGTTVRVRLARALQRR